MSEPDELARWFVATVPWKPELGEAFEAYGQRGEITACDPPRVLAWINTVFDDLIQPFPGSQPEYRALEPARLARTDTQVLLLGTDAHVNEGNYDLVVVADFDDVDGYIVYRDHPDHQAVIREHVAPILAERAAIQHAR